MPNLVRRLDYEADFVNAINEFLPFARQQLEQAGAVNRSVLSGLRKRLRTLFTPIVEQVATDTAFVMDEQVNSNLDGAKLVDITRQGSPIMAEQFATNFMESLQRQSDREQEETAGIALLASYLLSLDALTQDPYNERRAVEYVVETMTNVENAVADVVNQQLQTTFAAAQQEPGETIEQIEESLFVDNFQLEDYIDPRTEIVSEEAFSEGPLDDPYSLDRIYDDIDYDRDDYTPRETTPKPFPRPSVQIVETTETDKLPPLPNQYRPSREAIEIVEIEPDLEDYQDAFEQYLDRERQAGRERAASPPELVPIWRTQEDGRVCKTCDPLNGLPRFDWPAWVGSGPQAHPNCRCFLEWAYYVNGQPLQG